MSEQSIDRKTLEQKYAADVYTKVLAYKNNHSKDTKEDDAARNSYGGAAHKLPVLIRTAGLMQALHFISTRKKEETVLFGDLASVLGMTKDQLLDRTRTASLADYMHLTRQTLAVLVWFKRFAQSILDVDASQLERQDGGV